MIIILVRMRMTIQDEGQENRERKKEGDSWQRRQRPGTSLSTEQRCPGQSHQGWLRAPGPQKSEKLPEAAPACGIPGAHWHGADVCQPAPLGGLSSTAWRKGLRVQQKSTTHPAPTGSQRQGVEMGRCLPTDN